MLLGLAFALSRLSRQVADAKKRSSSRPTTVPVARDNYNSDPELPQRGFSDEARGRQGPSYKRDEMPLEPVHQQRDEMPLE